MKNRRKIGKIIPILICMLVIVSVVSVTTTAATFELNGTWWVDRDSDGEYDIQGNVTVSVITLGTQYIGMGLLDGVWNTTGSTTNGTIAGILWYRHASFLYRAYHGFFKGTSTNNMGLSEGIKGEFTAFDPDNLWTLDFPQGRALGKCPPRSSMK